MNASKANLINSISLITLGLWGFFEAFAEVEWKAATALIPVVFGLMLFFCTKGIKNQNKMIIFVLTNLLDNKLVIKFQNYKKLYFISDKSYSVHTALKSDMILFSKKSSIYNSYIGSN